MNNMTKENTQTAQGAEKGTKTPDIQLQHVQAMLVDFGLSDNEAKIYLALLGSGGVMGVSEIGAMAQIVRQYVYLALPSLVQKGLIIQVPYGKQSRYRAVPQQELEKIARRRLVATEVLVKELGTVSRIGYEQDFEIIQGNEAFQRHELDVVHTMAAHEEECIVGGASDSFARVMDTKLETYLRQKKAKNIGVKYLGSEAERNKYRSIAGQYPNQEYRFLSKLPGGISHLVIRHNTVSFYTFLNPALIYVIKSEAVAAHYKAFFMMLWEMANG